MRYNSMCLLFAIYYFFFFFLAFIGVCLQVFGEGNKMFNNLLFDIVKMLLKLLGKSFIPPPLCQSIKMLLPSQTSSNDYVSIIFKQNKTKKVPPTVVCSMKVSSAMLIIIYFPVYFDAIIRAHGVTKHNKQNKTRMCV